MKFKALILIVAQLFSALSIMFGQNQNTHKPPIELFVPRTHDLRLAKFDGPSFYQQKENWQQIIDSTWGNGLLLDQKVSMFNLFTKTLEDKFACFPNLPFNWDSVKTNYLNEIDSSTSQGRFAAIMSHLAFNMREAHTSAIDTAVAYTPLNPGVPLLIVGGYIDIKHFGAVSTVLPDSTILILRVVENHPLNLEPGDIILGYEGVVWKDLIEELLAAEIPLAGVSAGSETAFTFGKLVCAGMNWHLFETIDIKKFSTGEILHLPTSSMLSLVVEEDFLFNNEQLAIPSIPFPDYIPVTKGVILPSQMVNYGILPNSNIGLIYLYAEEPIDNQSSKEFFAALDALRSTDGLIVDMRYNEGGWSFFREAFSFLFNSSHQTLEDAHRCSPSNWELCPAGNSPTYQIISNKNDFYEKPIALLLGPNCVSMGDITAYRIGFHPNVRFFGKPTNASMGDNAYLSDSNWRIRYTFGDMFDVSDPNYYLNQKEFPLDYPVWFSPTDVAMGYDTVLEEAKEYISTLSHSFNAKIDSVYFVNESMLTVDQYCPSLEDIPATQVKALLKNESGVIDTLYPESSITDTLVNLKAPINLTQYGEDFYSITILTRNTNKNTLHTLPDIVRFTNAGPIEVTSCEPAQVNQLKKLRLTNITLTNQSTQRTIPTVSVSITSLDTCVSKIAGMKNFGDLAPGETKTVGGSIYAEVDTVKDYTFIAQISSDGVVYWKDTIYYTDTTMVGVDEETLLPREYALHQNYPNPFNPSTVIKYDVPKESIVTLKIYDILGREVKTLVKENKKPGTYKIAFNAIGLTSGVYFYKIMAGNFVETKKMLLLR